MIAIENHQDSSTYKAAEHLSYDISGNQAPAHAAAHSSADGNCGIEVCSGHSAEGESGNHNCHAPADEDVDISAALHSGSVKADVAANAVAKENEHSCSDKFCDIS